MQSVKGYDEIDDKLIDIAAMLIESTQKGNVKWRLTEGNASKFTAALPAASIYIEKFRSEHEYYRLSVLGDDGKHIRTINASDLDGFYDTFARLYDVAHKSAREPYVVLDDILAHLSKGTSV